MVSRQRNRGCLPPEISHLITEEDAPVNTFSDANLQPYSCQLLRHFDPQKLLSDKILRLYELRGSEYGLKANTVLAEMGLSLVLWEGVFEQSQALWLRWADAAGNLIPTGAELAAQERRRAEQERARAERLAEQLTALGVEPEG